MRADSLGARDMQAPTAAAGAVTCVSVQRLGAQGCFCSNLLAVTGHLVIFRFSSHGHRRFCHATNLKCMAATVPGDEKKGPLVGVHKDHIQSAVRILEQAKIAAARWDVAHSDFLTPPAIEDALKVLRRLSDIDVMVSGGYPQAERCRLSFGHRDAFLSVIKKDNIGYPGATAAISIFGDFMLDQAVHGDFLGSILGTGIAREKIGDILVQGDTGAQVIIAPEVTNFLEASLTQFVNVFHNVMATICTNAPLPSITLGRSSTYNFSLSNIDTSKLWLCR